MLDPSMNGTQEIHWWAEHVFVPIVFTLVGAGIGFATSQLNDWLEARRAKQAFLRAIRIELLGLDQQLQESLEEIRGSEDRLEKGGGRPPYMAGTLRTTVFAAQLGKLRDLSDPPLIEIVRFYSDLPVLQQIIEALNQQSTEFLKDGGIAQQHEKFNRIKSVLHSLDLKLNGFLERIRDLVPKLPG